MNKQTNTDCLTLKGGQSDVTPKFVPVGFGAVTGSTRTSFTSKAQESVYLKFFLANATTFGVVNDIRIGNQSLNCSDSAIDISVFSPANKRRPTVGVAVDGNIQMQIDVTLDGAGAEQFQGGFSCEAIERAPTIAEQGNAINKFFGLGSVAVPAGGSAQLNAQALRNCFLKSLLVKVHEPTSFGLVVTDVSIAGRSIFSGQATDGIGANVLEPLTADGLIGINTMIATNERVTVTVANSTGAIVIVGGSLYAE